MLAATYFWTNGSRVFFFWAAFILSRPLGATIGDFLDKPVADGGLNLSRPIASAVIGAFIIVCIFVLPQQAGRIRDNLKWFPDVAEPLMSAFGPKRTRRPSAFVSAFGGKDGVIGRQLVDS